MVHAAQRVARALDVSNVDFRVIDAERIELGDKSVDGILCRFSYMLVGDPLAALQETRRVLRGGGRVAFSTWAPPARNPWMTLSAGLMIERGLMERFSSDGPGMFALPDADAIVPLLTRAGFEHAEVEEMELAFRFENADELWIFASELQGPVALAIAGLDEPERIEIRSAIVERASDFATGIGYELPGLSVNVIAH
jgi:SAM-dependent methyltransferase